MLYVYTFFISVNDHLVKKDKQKKKLNQNDHVLVKLNIVIWH
jgi:hypothetical protein